MSSKRTALTRTAPALAALALSALVLAGCASSGEAAPAADSTTGATGAAEAAPVHVRLANIKAMPCAPTQQWLDHLPEGSTVEETFFTAPADQAAALLAGSVDIACTGVTIGLVGNEQGQDLRVVAQSATKGTQIIVGTDTGITDVEGLKGKKIGYAPNSIHDVLLRELLTEAGLNPGSDVELVKLGLVDMPAALCSGQIDAFTGNEPNSSVALLQGCGESIADPYETPVGDINVGLLTTQATIDSDPALVQAIVDAQAASVDELNGSVDDTLAIAAAWGFDAAASEKSLENIVFAWLVDETFIEEYQALSDRVQAIGLLTSAVEAAPIVDTSFAEAVPAAGGN